LTPPSPNAWGLFCVCCTPVLYIASILHHIPRRFGRKQPSGIRISGARGRRHALDPQAGIQGLGWLPDIPVKGSSRRQARRSPPSGSPPPGDQPSRDRGPRRLGLEHRFPRPPARHLDRCVAGRQRDVGGVDAGATLDRVNDPGAGLVDPREAHVLEAEAVVMLVAAREADRTARPHPPRRRDLAPTHAAAARGPRHRLSWQGQPSSSPAPHPRAPRACQGR
jgi:hypothetical protein